MSTLLYIILTITVNSIQAFWLTQCRSVVVSPTYSVSMSFHPPYQTPYPSPPSPTHLYSLIPPSPPHGEISPAPRRAPPDRSQGGWCVISSWTIRGHSPHRQDGYSMEHQEGGPPPCLLFGSNPTHPNCICLMKANTDLPTPSLWGWNMRSFTNRGFDTHLYNVFVVFADSSP